MDDFIKEPSAFPGDRGKLITSNNGLVNSHNPGMSLRDYFAAKAMQGMLAFGDTQNRSGHYLAYKAYNIADKMLEER